MHHYPMLLASLGSLEPVLARGDSSLSDIQGESRYRLRAAPPMQLIITYTHRKSYGAPWPHACIRIYRMGDKWLWCSSALNVISTLSACDTRARAVISEITFFSGSILFSFLSSFPPFFFFFFLLLPLFAYIGTTHARTDARTHGVIPPERLFR